ncbi:hypothetical protein MHI39_16290 [Heyndrickxia sp. FSL K6-6286]|uniref:hypothetical protein n=1 Tax=Heyndrickxia sp. FSL K6-6286 TaxID=2921510 RepID=UPI00315A8DE0
MTKRKAKATGLLRQANVLPLNEVSSLTLMSGRLFDPEEQGAAARQKRKAKATGLLRQANVLPLNEVSSLTLMSGRLFDPEEQGAATRQKRKARRLVCSDRQSGKSAFDVPKSAFDFKVSIFIRLLNKNIL